MIISLRLPVGHGEVVNSASLFFFGVESWSTAHGDTAGKLQLVLTEFLAGCGNRLGQGRDNRGV